MPEIVISDQVLLRISFGLAAFAFEFVLLILHTVLGYGHKDKNVKFQMLIIIVMIGNIISILDNFFRISNSAITPIEIQLLLQLVALVLNVILTYNVYLYFKTFVKNASSGSKWIETVNRLIVIGSAVFAVVLYIRALIQIGNRESDVAIPNFGRIIIGYVVELYFLIFSMIIVIRYRKSFGRRALITALGAYTVIIIAILLQLVQTRGILLNYFGAAIGTYIFYIGVEIPDYRDLKKSLEVVQTLVKAIDAKDRYTNGHSTRVATYAREIARRAGFTEKYQNDMYMMGLLHDIGKIGIPDSIINNPGKLSEEEYEEIKKHPVIGAKILESIPDMPHLAKAARWHHERYDGNGYPDSLKGDEIPTEARIIAVADAYDAMTSNRSYRSRMEQHQVIEQLENGKCTQFDEEFASIMLQMMMDDKNFEMKEQ